MAKITLAEKEVLEDFVKKGYQFLRAGHPDFVFYKGNDSNLKDIIFVEVKTPKDSLSKEQIIYGKILKTLNLDYRIETKLHSGPAVIELGLGISVKCHRCKKKWVYYGAKVQRLKKYPQYVSCPKCNTSVKLKEIENE
jgi:hypothetical protein